MQWATTVGFEKILQRTEKGEQTENREQTEKAITEATLITVPMEQGVEGANTGRVNAGVG